MFKWKNKAPINKQLLLRQLLLIAADILSFATAAFLALWLRHEFDIDELLNARFLHHVLYMLPGSLPVMVVIYWLLGLYNSLWEFAGEREMVMIVIGAAATSVTHTLLLFMVRLGIPRSFVILQFLFLLLFTLLTRFSYRFVRKQKEKYQHSTAEEARRTMVIGAGDAGATIVRELQRSRYSQNKVVCLIDDDRNKIGRYMYGIPVAGSTGEIIALAQRFRVEEIVFAIPSASEKRRVEILELCNKTDCKLRALPGIYQLVNGEVSVQKLKDVQIEDLLLRDSVSLNGKAERNYYHGKTVLVTGGGGSIGSELCRQIAGCKPKKLIIFDIYENNAYEIQQELKYKYGERLDLAVEIGSVRDRERMDAVFAIHRPEIVFHAAAHKHVPLMEHSGCEAIKNNVFGTVNTADMAEKYGVEKFILISTDKAVNPTNIMGASKRLCEMMVQCRTGSKTSFAAVRFGNVLGSNGSVIPLFKRQIEAGGPVTVTDKRIIRYFMTISEASQLVMEAGAMAKNGELFVLDMGKPVRIYDLAVNMIRLSGLKPNVDIKIEEIGLRPGEKLYEELLMKDETLDKTENELIFIERDKPLSREEAEEKLQILAGALEKAEDHSGSPYIKEAIRRTVPTFRNPEELNKNAEQAAEMKALHQN
ncbi:MAG: polysaccharide biosynthesis protein [Clostridia bacterium]|nr:polysaccharide biosynthesis protein [Clostridia bacterium]